MIILYTRDGAITFNYSGRRMSRRAKRKKKRSGSEICPICMAKTKLCRHHINGRDIARSEEEWNIAWICPNCHDLVHDDGGRITIEGWFNTTNGRELIWRWCDEDPITGRESTPPKY